MVLMSVVMRLVAVVAFGWYALHGPMAAVIVSGTVAFVLVAKDAIATPDLIKEFWPSFLGLLVGATVCWMTGFLLVAIIGSSETVYVGPGLDRWNLPGTILGGAIWISATVWGVKRHEAHKA
jgi:hypothetical protein